MHCIVPAKIQQIEKYITDACVSQRVTERPCIVAVAVIIVDAIATTIANDIQKVIKSFNLIRFDTIIYDQIWTGNLLTNHMQ